MKLCDWVKNRGGNQPVCSYRSYNLHHYIHTQDVKKLIRTYWKSRNSKVCSVSVLFSYTHVGHTCVAPSKHSLMPACRPHRCLIIDLFGIINPSSLLKAWRTDHIHGSERSHGKSASSPSADWRCHGKSAALVVECGRDWWRCRFI